MQTSSNFFSKSLFNPQQVSQKGVIKPEPVTKIADPLHSSQQLSPWTQINPKYNFNIDRLSHFKQKQYKQKINQDNTQLNEQGKEIKSQMISNLFNFYKNNKEKKKSTLNNQKRKIKNHPQSQISSWSLPPISERPDMENDLLVNTNDLKGDHKASVKNIKKMDTIIQSISIQEYLKKLKQKQRFLVSTQLQSIKPTQPVITYDQFTMNRFMRQKSKSLLKQTYITKQIRSIQMNYRYGPSKHYDSLSVKKKKGTSQVQSLQHSFQMYRKAAEGEDKKRQQRSIQHTIQKKGFSIQDKNLFKSHVPVNSLFLSSQKDSHIINTKLLPPKKYNTISYDRPFSYKIIDQKLKQEGFSFLPKVKKQSSFNK